MTEGRFPKSPADNRSRRQAVQRRVDTWYLNSFPPFREEDQTETSGGRRRKLQKAGPPPSVLREIETVLGGYGSASWWAPPSPCQSPFPSPSPGTSWSWRGLQGGLSGSPASTLGSLPLSPSAIGGPVGGGGAMRSTLGSSFQSPHSSSSPPGGRSPPVPPPSPPPCASSPFDLSFESRFLLGLLHRDRSKTRTISDFSLDLKVSEIDPSSPFPRLSFRQTFPLDVLLFKLRDKIDNLEAHPSSSSSLPPSDTHRFPFSPSDRQDVDQFGLRAGRGRGGDWRNTPRGCGDREREEDYLSGLAGKRDKEREKYRVGADWCSSERGGNKGAEDFACGEGMTKGEKRADRKEERDPLGFRGGGRGGQEGGREPSRLPPYLAAVDLHEYHAFPGVRVPRKGNLQLVLLNSEQSAFRIFFFSYDCTAMPKGTRTFIRQRAIDERQEGACQVHFVSPSSGRIYLHGFLRLMFHHRVEDDPSVSTAALSPPMQPLAEAPPSPPFARASNSRGREGVWGKTDRAVDGEWTLSEAKREEGELSGLKGGKQKESTGREGVKNKIGSSGPFSFLTTPQTDCSTPAAPIASGGKAKKSTDDAAKTKSQEKRDDAHWPSLSLSHSHHNQKKNTYQTDPKTAATACPSTPSRSTFLPSRDPPPTALSGTPVPFFDRSVTPLSASEEDQNSPRGTIESSSHVAPARFLKRSFPPVDTTSFSAEGFDLAISPLESLEAQELQFLPQRITPHGGMEREKDRERKFQSSRRQGGFKGLGLNLRKGSGADGVSSATHTPVARSAALPTASPSPRSVSYSDIPFPRPPRPSSYEEQITGPVQNGNGKGKASAPAQQSIGSHRRVILRGRRSRGDTMTSTAAETIAYEMPRVRRKFSERHGMGMPGPFSSSDSEDPEIEVEVEDATGECRGPSSPVAGGRSPSPPAGVLPVAAAKAAAAAAVTCVVPEKCCIPLSRAEIHFLKRRILEKRQLQLGSRIESATVASSVPSTPSLSVSSRLSSPVLSVYPCDSPPCTPSSSASSLSALAAVPSLSSSHRDGNPNFGFGLLPLPAAAPLPAARQGQGQLQPLSNRPSGGLSETAGLGCSLDPDGEEFFQLSPCEGQRKSEEEEIGMPAFPTPFASAATTAAQQPGALSWGESKKGKGSLRINTVFRSSASSSASGSSGGIHPSHTPVPHPQQSQRGSSTLKEGDGTAGSKHSSRPSPQNAALTPQIDRGDPSRSMTAIGRPLPFSSPQSLSSRRPFAPPPPSQSPSNMSAASASFKVAKSPRVSHSPSAPVSVSADERESPGEPHGNTPMPRTFSRSFQEHSSILPPSNAQQQSPEGVPPCRAISCALEEGDQLDGGVRGDWSESDEARLNTQRSPEMSVTPLSPLTPACAETTPLFGSCGSTDLQQQPVCGSGGSESVGGRGRGHQGLDRLRGRGGLWVEAGGDRRRPSRWARRRRILSEDGAEWQRSPMMQTGAARPFGFITPVGGGRGGEGAPSSSSSRAPRGSGGASPPRILFPSTPVGGAGGGGVGGETALEGSPVTRERALVTPSVSSSQEREREEETPAGPSDSHEGKEEEEKCGCGEETMTVQQTNMDLSRSTSDRSMKKQQSVSKSSSPSPSRFRAFPPVPVGPSSSLSNGLHTLRLSPETDGEMHNTASLLPPPHTADGEKPDSVSSPARCLPSEFQSGEGGGPVCRSTDTCAGDESIKSNSKPGVSPVKMTNESEEDCGQVGRQQHEAQQHADLEHV